MSVDNNIPNAWVETTLGEVCDVQSGGTPSTKNHNYWNGNIGWITPKDLSNYTKVFIKKGERSITKIGLGNSSAKLLPKHTILFSSRAPIGYVVIAENEITTNQGFKNLVCDEENSHYKFFYYLLKLKADHIEKLSSGSTFSEASASLMKSIEITIPQSIEEQTAIAKILTAFDDKIELLQAQNKTLETTAQTIFKEWFGKYQIGAELPDGWRVGKLGDLISFNPREKINYSNKYEFFDMKCLSEDSMSLNTGVYKNSKSGSSFRVNDTLLAKITPCLENGKTGFVSSLENEIGRGSTEFVVMRSNENSNPYFIYSLARNNRFREYAIKSMTGTSGRQRVRVDLLKEYLIFYKLENMFDFDKIGSTFFKKIKKNAQQIQTLKKTRDTLLPKLMSGQLRVDEFKETAV